MVSPLPFSVYLGNLTEAEIDGLYDIVVKTEFNASVTNFQQWSWRPNVKVYDQINNEWLAYRADILAYGTQINNIVWDYEDLSLENYYGQDEYDKLQRHHDPRFYSNNSEEISSDNCSVVFKISKDMYPNFPDLLRKEA